MVESSVPVAESSISVVGSSAPVVDSSAPVAESPIPAAESTVPAAESTVPTVGSTVPTVGSTNPAAPPNPAAPADPAAPVATTIGPPPGLPWGFVAFFAGFGGYYLVSLVITGTVAAVAIAPDSVASSLRGPIVFLALLPNLFLGLGPAVLSWWRGFGPRVDFGIRFTREDLSIGFTCGVAALAIGLVVNYLVQTFVFRTQQPNAAQELGELSGGRSVWLAVALLFVVFIAPLTEEMLVRGALWGALEHHRVPRLMILPLTALVFAFLHQEPTLTLALFCQGLALGTARMRTGRIGASMIAHATNNVVPAVVLWVASKP
jgi:uncharacterized protein